MSELGPFSKHGLITGATYEPAEPVTVSIIRIYEMFDSYVTACAHCIIASVNELIGEFTFSAVG